MDLGAINLKIVIILAVGLAFASILGNLAQRSKLSPIVGYLIAGYLIGPYSPGFVADLQIAEQLAEVGVVLMMFGVGMQFKLKDLVKVKNIAIPGAVGQTLIATLVGMLLILSIGWSVESGILFGLSIGVASTVVLVRMLVDNKLVNTPQGHATVGWLIVEDIITVIALILVPVLATSAEGGGLSFWQLTSDTLFIVFKFILLAAIMFTWGARLVSFILTKVARNNSQELFTLTILAVTFVIATCSTLFFGSSIALGAFIAGMVIGQTDVRHEVVQLATPLRDIFVVVFFLSVGMLFNPIAIWQHVWIFLGVLGIIMVIKPLAAFLITIVLKHPYKTAFTAAIALAQIGEFSFILAEAGRSYNLIPHVAYDIIVACAILSIALNPLLFKLFHNKMK